MKFMLLIYQNPATWTELSDQQRCELMSEADPIVQELVDAGE